jgi:hypothetical protein
VQRRILILRFFQFWIMPVLMCLIMSLWECKNNLYATKNNTRDATEDQGVISAFKSYYLCHILISSLVQNVCRSCIMGCWETIPC